ncbi:hypothetical protein ACFX1T_044296 [Malus domestica]
MRQRQQTPGNRDGDRDSGWSIWAVNERGVASEGGGGSCGRHCLGGVISLSVSVKKVNGGGAFKTKDDSNEVVYENGGHY